MPSVDAPTKPGKIDKVEFKRMYLGGVKMTNIARRFNCTVQSCKRMRREMNLPARRPGQYQAAGAGKIDLEVFAAMYSTPTLTRHIAAHFGVSEWLLHRFRRRHGIPGRTSLGIPRRG